MEIAPQAAQQAQVFNDLAQGGAAGAGQPGGRVGAAAKDAATQEQFGEVWKKIQSQYGGKAERPKEIKKTLGKDDFVKIMVTQMKNQDPTSPFKAEQFASELAQYASVEQLQNINQNINKLASKQNPVERMAMTGMIGKSVTVDRNRFPHVEGESANLAFSLPKDASEVNVQVVNDAGEVLYEKQLGTLKAGENTASWDGLNRTGQAVKSGDLNLKVEAKDGRGAPMAIQSKAQAKVVGISFEGQEPIFLVGDIAKPEKVKMQNIVRIESDSAENGLSGAIPGARSLAGAAGAFAAPKMPQSDGARSLQSVESSESPEPSESAAPVVPTPQGNFFTFRRGEGSSNLEANDMSADQSRALQEYEARQLVMEAQAKASASAAARARADSGLQPRTTPEQAPNQAQAARAAQAADTQPGFPNGLNSTQ